MEKKERFLSLVIGMAGHVDHGKTTLVKMLTGIDTDRLKEEKERGLTIEPGFVSFKLSSGQIISIVDVPGHERFIKNMLRGISGVDCVLLVIAADDGVMPQTREHLDIVRLLDIKQGIIVITKVDLVDKETLEIVREDVYQLVRGTFLEKNPLIYFSAKTGEGLEEVKKAIENMATGFITRNPEGPFRMPIDRVLTIQGYGTVVTGTIASGRVVKGQPIEVYPLNLKTIARYIQSHNIWVDVACAGQRVGINIPGIGVERLERGMVVANPGVLSSTYIVNGELQYLGSNKNPLKNMTKIKFYTGTSEVVARVNLMDRENLFPGQTCFAQIRFVKPLSPYPFDKFIVRTLSPVMTVGGGIILETNPKKYKKYDPETLNHLKMIAEKRSGEIVEELIKRSGCIPLKIEEIAKGLYISTTETKYLCDRLFHEGKITVLKDGSMVYKDACEGLKIQVVEKIGDFHRANPSMRGVSVEDIRSKLATNLSRILFGHVLHELSKEGVILIEKGTVRLHGFKKKLDHKQKDVYDHLDRVCRASGLRPLPTDVLDKIRTKHGEREVEAVLKIMINEGRIIRLKNHRLIHFEAIEKIKNILKEYLEKKVGITIGEAVELLGIGRTQLIPILEYLDSIKFTIRAGDKRTLRKQSNTF